MEKVKVSKFQYYQLKELEKKSVKELKSWYSEMQKCIKHVEDVSYNNLTWILETLANGYELEMTPEEKLLEEFNKPSLCEFDRGVDAGIRTALDILDIKIKGINA